MWVDGDLFNHLLVWGHFGCLEFFAVRNTAAVAISYINLSIYVWLISQKSSLSIACLRTKPCPPDFSLMPFEMKVEPIFHQRGNHMEWVRQDEVWGKGRNRFKMGLDLCQDVWREASYRAPLPAPDWRRGRGLDPLGPLISLFEAIPRGFDVLSVGEVELCG